MLNPRPGTTVSQRSAAPAAPPRLQDISDTDEWRAGQTAFRVAHPGAGNSGSGADPEAAYDYDADLRASDAQEWARTHPPAPRPAPAPTATPGPAPVSAPSENSGTILATALTLGIVGGLFLWLTNGPSMVQARANPSDDDEPFKDDVTKTGDIIIQPEEIFAFTPVGARAAMKLAVSKLRDIPFAVAHAVVENIAPHIDGHRLAYGGQQGTYLWIQKSYQSRQLQIVVMLDTPSLIRPSRPAWMNDLQSVGFRHTTFGSATGMRWAGFTSPRAAPRTNPSGPEPGT